MDAKSLATLKQGGMSIELPSAQLKADLAKVGETVVKEWTDKAGAEGKAILDAYKAAVRSRFPAAPVLPSQSAGATDGAFLRAAGIPVYGFGGLWGVVGESANAHGLDERVWVEGFHGQVPIWREMLKRVAG